MADLPDSEKIRRRDLLKAGLFQQLNSLFSDTPQTDQFDAIALAFASTITCLQLCLMQYPDGGAGFDLCVQNTCRTLAQTEDAAHGGSTTWEKTDPLWQGFAKVLIPLPPNSTWGLHLPSLNALLTNDVPENGNGHSSGRKITIEIPI